MFTTTKDLMGASRQFLVAIDNQWLHRVELKWGAASQRDAASTIVVDGSGCVGRRQKGKDQGTGNGRALRSSPLAEQPRSTRRTSPTTAAGPAGSAAVPSVRSTMSQPKRSTVAVVPENQ